MVLILPFPPSANRYWRSERGVVHPSAEAKAYKARVGWLCVKSRLKPTDGPVVVYVSVYRPRKNGDLDNCLKVLLDSVRGFLFHDDAQVVEIHATRGDDKVNPRAEIRAMPIEKGALVTVETP